MAERYAFSEMWRDLRADFRTCGGRSWAGAIVTLFWGTAFQLLFTYRLSRWLAGGRLGVLAIPLRWMQHALSASEISPQAILGQSVRLPHPVGIVIGAGAVIENDAWVFQGVTIGSHGRNGEDKTYPRICRGARIFAGAKVIGGVRVGVDAVVGANSVVLADVPDGTTAVGVPARVIVA